MSKKRGTKMDNDKSSRYDTVVSSPQESPDLEPTIAEKSKFGKSAQNNYTILVFVFIFAAVGGYLLFRSFAATTALIKVWDSDVDWSAGSKSNVAIASGSVSLGSTSSSTSTNLALNKPAAASSLEYNSLTASNAVDGNTATRWSSQFSDPQWIRVDLGAVYPISQVKLTWEMAYGKAYQIQVSNDAVSWTTIYSTTTSTGGINDLKGLSGSGRYVRMYGTARGTPWGYSLYEIAIYGSSSSTVTTSSNPYACPNNPTQQIGSRGDCVRRIQWFLNKINNAGLSIDGDFGNNTLSAVKNYQQANSLQVDGVVGPNTWASLEAKGVTGPPAASSAVSYASSGTITLSYNATSTVDWTSLTPASTLPSGTNITYQVRTSSDNVNWSGWSANIATASDSQYIQIQATLRTTNTSTTPLLNTLTLGYNVNSTTPPPITSGTCSGVAMNNGQADIDSHAAGTTYCLSGTHNWKLIPKSGDKLIGNGTAVLDGQNTNTWAIYVFDRDVDNVEVSNIEIRNYKVEYQRGAILSSQNDVSTGWILRNLRVHDNGTSAGGSGASLGPNWQVIGGRYYNNRQAGLSHGASGVVVDGVEIDHNNFTNNSYTSANINCGDEGGGFKWAALNGVTIKNSKIHDNACKGLWADFNGDNSVITNNQIYNNWDSGIFIEISTGSIITGNTLYGNGFHSDFGPTCYPFLWGGAITIAASDKVEIANNTLYGNCSGITGVQQNRPDGTPGLLQSINVHNNSIAGPGGRTGTIADNGANLTNRNIIFTNNTLSNGMTFCNLQC